MHFSACWFIFSLYFFFSFLTKIYFLKRGIRFQMLGCVFVTALYCAGKASVTLFVRGVLSISGLIRCSKVLWEMWVQLCAFKVLSLFFLQRSIFQNKKPAVGELLGGPVSRTLCFHCWGHTSSIPGWGTKIPQASSGGEEKKKIPARGANHCHLAAQ